MNNKQNKFKKRGLAVLLSLAICAGMFNVTAFAADGEPLNEGSAAVQETNAETTEKETGDDTSGGGTEEGSLPEQSPVEVDAGEEAPASDSVQAFLDAVNALPEVGTGNAKKVMTELIPPCNTAYDALTDEQKASDDVREAKFVLAVTAVEANLMRYGLSIYHANEYTALSAAAWDDYQAAEEAGLADRTRVQDACERLAVCDADAEQLKISYGKAAEMEALLDESPMTEENAAKYYALLAELESAYAVVREKWYPNIETKYTEAVGRVSHVEALLAFYNAAAAVDAVLDQPMTAENAAAYPALMTALREAYDAVQATNREYPDVTAKYDDLTACESHVSLLLAFSDAVEAVRALGPVTKENDAQCLELAEAVQETYNAAEAAGAADRQYVRDALAEVNALKDTAEQLLGITTPVTDEATLRKALAQGKNPIVLEGSFTVSDTIAVTGQVTLDLNGQTLTWDNQNVNNSSLFRVEKGGVLTITDSSDTVGYTTDYTVTTSAANDEDGTTTEATETRTAQAKGGVITLQKEIQTGGEENLSAVITVNGGKLVMENGIIDGAQRKLARGILVDNGGLVSMEGGAIIRCAARANGNPYGSGIFVKDGSLAMSGGIIADNSDDNIYRRGSGVGLRSGSLDLSGGVITGNKAGVGGGVGAEGGSGSITIYGNAVIAGNSALFSNGGGVNANGNGYTVTIRNGALITGNTAVSAGGGVSTGGSALLQAEGGVITGNEAHTGGGINTDNLLMTGGIIAGNIALGDTDGQEYYGKPMGNGEGGGIRVSAGSAVITGGYITNNETRTTIDWGGGGLFVSGDATIKLQNLMVVGNTAQGLGGGVGGCSTGQVAVSATDGLASFGNTAYGNKENGAHAAYKWEDQAALKNDEFLYYGSNDFFCAHSSYVSDAMLGGGSANWHGSQDTGAGYRGSSAEDGEIDVRQLAIPNGGAAAAQYLMGLSAAPSEEDQAKAMSAAKVFITGNKSSTHGGGIMCNGVMFIGTIENKTTVFSSVPVEAKKVYRNVDGAAIALNGGEFTFALVKADDFAIKGGKPVYTSAQTAVNDENGKVLFTINDLTQKGEYTYYMVEEPGTGNIVYDPAIYKVEVKVSASQTISWQIDTKLTVTTYSGEVTGITAMEIDEDGQLVETDSVDNAVFTNTYTPDGPDKPDEPDGPDEPNIPYYPETPAEEVPEEEIPLTPPEEEIPEEETPLAPPKEEEEEEIPEEDIPLVDAPKTGNNAFWAWAVISAAGLAILALAGKKRKSAQ